MFSFDSERRSGRGGLGSGPRVSEWKAYLKSVKGPPKREVYSCFALLLAEAEFKLSSPLSII